MKTKASTKKKAQNKVAANVAKAAKAPEAQRLAKASEQPKAAEAATTAATEGPESARSDKDKSENKDKGEGEGKAPRSPAASSPAVRKSMQGNKCKDTKPELLVRQHLRKAGLTGYRLQWKAPGRPDIAWPGKKVCIQVMGCFWHRHEGCKYATSPKSHTEYWVVKFDRNVERDKKNEEALKEAGWKVHLIWECQLKKNAIEQTMGELLPILAKELGKDLKADPHPDPEAGPDTNIQVDPDAGSNAGQPA